MNEGLSTIETDVANAWKEAAKDLDFRFSSPFEFTTKSGETFRFIGLVHDFGGPNGTVIGLIGPEDSAAARALGDPGYFWSFLHPEGHRRYARALFIDILDDWGWFGPSDRKPAWYSGKPWV